jgi:hypothetical protein
LAGALAFGIVMNASMMANADEGGVSMWLPGFFGSLAATPLQPGWALGTIYYHPLLDASGNVATSRQITIGRFNPNLDLSLSASLQARPDLLLVVPSYVFATPVLGGQAAVVFLQGWGRSEASIDATLTAILGPLSAVRSVSLSDSRYGFGDFGAQGNLRWNFGVHNFMTYVAAIAPTGTYDATRLANFGIGHWAVDGGGGYTYFNPQTGHELSAVLGFTYNFRNPYTDYQNGVSMPSTGAFRSSSRSNFTSALSAIGTTSSPPTSALPRSSASSSRASQGSDPRPGTCSRWGTSGTCSRWGTCRVISI